MFVWLHLGFPLALRLLGVRYPNVPTCQMPVHDDVHSIGPSFLVSSPHFSTLSRVTLNHLLALSSPGTLANYPTDFGKWKDFLVVSVVLLSIHYFLALAAHSSGWLTAVGRGGPRDRSVYVDNELSDTVWTRVFPYILETANGE